MICTCAEFAPNIAKVNAPLMTAVARNPSTAKQYDGVPFRFCPWCGARLVASSAAPVPELVPISDANRCPHYHYLSGWCCQLDAGHAGPCLANAGPRGEVWPLLAGHGIYAWHQPANEPACNQRRCPSPMECRCAAAPQ